DLWDTYHSSLWDESRKQCWGTGAFGGSQHDKKMLNGTINNANRTITGDAFNVKRNNQAEDNGECSKQTIIDQYFCAHTITLLSLLQKISKINADTLDFNDVKNSHSQELSLAKFISPIDIEILMILNRKEDKNLESLLEKYNKAIIDATTGYYVDLYKLWITISETPFAVDTTYTTFLKCFQMSFNPLNDADASKGKIENIDRKKQLDLTKNVDKCKSCIGGWYHDAVLTMKAENRDFQIVFGEVIGNAFKHDKKLSED
ncbi:7183_t:CDS:2, partial [Cetraspora pellucida]